MSRNRVSQYDAQPTSTSIDTDMCWSFLQYDEYYVFFQAHMQPKGWLTMDEFQQTLNLINEKMETCLVRGLSTP